MSFSRMFRGVPGKGCACLLFPETQNTRTGSVETADVWPRSPGSTLGSCVSGHLDWILTDGRLDALPCLATVMPIAGPT